MYCCNGNYETNLEHFKVFIAQGTVLKAKPCGTLRSIRLARAAWMDRRAHALSMAYGLADSSDVSRCFVTMPKLGSVPAPAVFQ
jgi:hypothetical protein